MSHNHADDYGWRWPGIVGRFGTTYSMYANGTSQQAGPFADGITLVRVAVSGGTGHVYIAIGTNPTALDDTGPIIPMNHIEYFEVKPGEKMAFLQPHGGTTFVSVTEML